MIIKEFVEITAETNEVPIKYSVMEVTVGAAAGTTYLWLKVAGYGMNTVVNYDAYVESVQLATFSGSGQPPTGIAGTMNAYSVVALTAVEAYDSKYGNHEGPYNIG